MRAISTLLDVTLFLLLLSAAATTLALAPDPPSGPVAVDDDASVLAATTAEIEYTVDGAEREAHGTPATLLARAAIANATVDGKPIATGHSTYVAAVRSATRERLGAMNRTQVLAQWSPYRSAPLRGTATVGADPPPGVDVTVATVTVPTPAPTGPDDRQTRAREGGYAAVAEPTARATTRVLFPRDEAGLPSRGASPAASVTAHRAERLAAATDSAVAGQLTDGNLATVRERLTAGLADRFEADLRDRFDTPAAAARAARAGTVRITLRRWEP